MYVTVDETRRVEASGARRLHSVTWRHGAAQNEKRTARATSDVLHVVRVGKIRRTRDSRWSRAARKHRARVLAGPQIRHRIGAVYTVVVYAGDRRKRIHRRAISGD